MSGYAKWFYRDYGGEMSTATFPIDTVTDANYTAIAGDILALRTALDAIVIGSRVGQDYAAWVSKGVAVANPSPLAQRQISWQFQAHQAATPTNVITASFPIADITLLATKSEYMDSTSAEFIALKDAFDNVVVGWILDAIKYVGKTK